MQALTEADDSCRCAFVFIVKAAKTGSYHAHFSAAANRLGSGVSVMLRHSSDLHFT